MGGKTSLIVTVEVVTAVFPLGSTTVNVTVFKPISLHVKSDLSMLNETLTLSDEPLSISLAVMLAIPLASRSTVKSLDTAVGVILSLTVTIAVPKVKFPDSSYT